MAKNKKIKKNWLIIGILLIFVILRFYLSFGFTNDDLFAQYQWGKIAYSMGNLKEFYTWDIWNGSSPNHPPLISALYFFLFPLHSWLTMFLSELGNFIALNHLAPTKFLWLFNFSIWFGTKLYGSTPFLYGIIFLLKQFMILADLGIAIAIYYLCRQSKIDWKKPVLMYFVLPFSWYLSSSWGQSDQLSFIFFFISIFLVFSKKLSILSPLFYVIAASLKPTCLIFAPIYLFNYFKQKKSLLNLIFGGLLSIGFFIWMISWFTNGNILTFVITVLPQKIDTSGGLINYNAFNFWYIFYPFVGKETPLDSITILGLSIKNFGLLLSVFPICISFFVIKSKKIASFFASMFIVGFGYCLFMVGIHERYFFSAIMALLLVSIYYPKYWKYFLIMSTIFTLNLLNAYFPCENISWVKDAFKFNNFLIGKILSIINIIFYFLITKFLVKTFSQKNVQK